MSNVVGLMQATSSIELELMDFDEMRNITDNIVSLTSPHDYSVVRTRVIHNIAFEEVTDFSDNALLVRVVLAWAVDPFIRVSDMFLARAMVVANLSPWEYGHRVFFVVNVRHVYICINMIRECLISDPGHTIADHRYSCRRKL